jgi:hypothetical protein
MLLQGSLQAVFDALYEMGVIDPVLKMDWSEAKSAQSFQMKAQVRRAMAVVSVCRDDVQQLITELGMFDDETLQGLAMEVAREYADFHARTSLQ